jgi:AcrR family transcriptional regulator
VLEDALLDAAWEELVAVGYAAFTIENVADRAHTSRPVLYRRWPSRAQLAVAAISHVCRHERTEPPDTGNLRDDLVALLRGAARRQAELAALMSVHMGQFFTERGATPGELREILAPTGRRSGYDELLRRAAERGEIDLDWLSPRITHLPLDLLRHDLLLTLQPVPEATIVEIVDDVFLPLVWHHTATRNTTTGGAG